MRSQPLIHDINIDDDTGELTIDSENIPLVRIKYYKIDEEILFSKTPFVKDQAVQFSYVKPFVEVE